MRRKSNLGTIIVVFILIAAIIALGVFSSGFINWDVNTWFKASGSDAGDSGAIGDGENIEVDKVTPLPRNLIFTARSAETSATSGIQLKAIITPEDATNKGIKWSCEWADAAAEWAVGKSATTFLSIYDDPATGLVTVKCNEAFGAKIVITATSYDNPNAKGTCTVDFMQQISDITLTDQHGSDIAVSGAGDALRFDTQDIVTYGYNITSKPYTVTNNYTFTFKTALSDNLLSALSSNGIPDLNFVKEWEVIPAGGLINIPHIKAYFGYDTLISNCSYFASGLGVGKRALAKNLIKREADMSRPLYTLTVKGASATNTFEKTYNISVSATAFIIPVEDVVIDDDNIIFTDSVIN